MIWNSLLLLKLVVKMNSLANIYARYLRSYHLTVDQQQFTAVTCLYSVLALWLFLVCDDVFVMCRNLRICLRSFRNITTRLWPNETCHCVGGTGELLTSLVS